MSAIAIFDDEPPDTGATARHFADSVGSRGIEIRGAEPTAGISGTVGFVFGLAGTLLGAGVADRAPASAGGRYAGRTPLVSSDSACLVTIRK